MATTAHSSTRSSACGATPRRIAGDSQPFTRVDLDEAFHSASLKWYRDRFHATNPGFDVEQPHHEFLYEWGYLVKEGGKPLPGVVSMNGAGPAVSV